MVGATVEGTTRSRLPLLCLLVLPGCYPFAQAWQNCQDAGRCVEDVDGGEDAGVDAGLELDAGCDQKVFNGVCEVCPSAPVMPMHGSAYLHSGSLETARAWCVEKGYNGVYEYRETGQRNCNSCYYVTGSVGYGFVVQWGSPYSGCDSCGAINEISCY